MLAKYQRRPHVEPVTLRRAGLRAPKSLDRIKRRLVVRFGPNGFEFNRHRALFSCRSRLSRGMQVGPVVQMC
jgi:hypothetical protein